ncbi:uncharacterized protein LACBIDRAFT_328349 [Laccaria bicolor S238N-H82]|uniref:Predicted protein n=1 Tax=Laccaria bicolor (strain S238N-H82 / ATCC MYA-4686) TaxID=486041 RepID=B0DEL4_LACBS|nr:uncharacterized protein LACBIDRAFT_328349 [Laccaria bicolor S238N-H82]EDR06956.1 predicted protein [Laccaria bicolor S238N-H82]|eukprot:XP_001882329.1 predicted protein [Laccaria bicolor S238N-H82]
MKDSSDKLNEIVVATSARYRTKLGNCGRQILSNIPSCQGRFDACVSPQYQFAQPSWAPHVRRHSYSTLESPEFANLVEITDGTSRRFIKFRYIDELLVRNEKLDIRITELQVISHSNPAIALEDTWRWNRPVVTSEDINELRTIGSFDRVLDELTQLQRNLKMKVAWIDMVEKLQSTPSWSRASNRPFEMADNSYMGVWLSDTDQEDVDWFLAHRIPCFIAHKLRGGELERLIDEGFGRKDPSFIHGTPVENLNTPFNAVEAHLRRQHVIITHSDEDNAIGSEEPLDPPEALAASYSLSQRQWARGGEAPIAYSSLPSHTTHDAIPSYQIDFSDWDADPLDYIEIDPHRVAWVRPPPVIRSSGGKWEKWAEKTIDKLEGQFFVAKVGQNYSDFHGASYFDRANNREIFLLEEAPLLPGVVSERETFGFPCPRHLHFVVTPQNKDPRPAKASSWLYLIKDPKRNDVGLRAMQPEAGALPFKDEFRASGSKRPPSPPPSPGPPGPPPPMTFIPYSSPETRGINDGERPISPADSLLAAPQEETWELDLGDDAMGPQIPGIPSEDVEMSMVDLGSNSPELTSQPLPLDHPHSSTPNQPAPGTSSSAPTPLRTTTAPPSSRARTRMPRQSSPHRASRKHGRRRSRTPSPPRRRGDSYRPTGEEDRRRSTRRPSEAVPAPPPQNPWSSPTLPAPNSWAPANPYAQGHNSMSWGPPPGYMPWGFNPQAPAPWSVHYPGYYPTENSAPNWPLPGYPFVPPHNCLSCHNCRLQSPPLTTTGTPTSFTPLSQRLRNPAPLLSRFTPSSSLAQWMQPSSSEFLQGSSSRPLAGPSSRTLAQRMGTDPEDGELPDWDEDESTSQARRSRRGGRKERERDKRRAARGEPPAPGKGKRRDRRGRGDDDGSFV